VILAVVVCALALVEKAVLPFVLVVVWILLVATVILSLLDRYASEVVSVKPETVRLPLTATQGFASMAVPNQAEACS
jgi:hypothetical protein